MKAGDEINCIHCGKHGFLVKKAKMEGWKKVGDMLICSSCGQIIVDVEESPIKEDIEEDIPSNDKLDSLLSFLGTEQLEKKTIEVGEKTFCRDCIHYVKHPFFSKCGLNNEDINPMDDCESYKKMEDEK